MPAVSTGLLLFFCPVCLLLPEEVTKVIVRPLSTVEYTSVASVFHSRQWSD